MNKKRWNISISNYKGQYNKNENVFEKIRKLNLDIYNYLITLIEEADYNRAPFLEILLINKFSFKKFYCEISAA